MSFGNWECGECTIVRHLYESEERGGGMDLLSGKVEHVLYMLVRECSKICAYRVEI